MRTISRFLALALMLGSLLGSTGCAWEYYDDWNDHHGHYDRDHHDGDRHDRDHRDRHDRDHDGDRDRRDRD